MNFNKKKFKSIEIDRLNDIALSEVLSPNTSKIRVLLLIFSLLTITIIAYHISVNFISVIGFKTGKLNPNLIFGILGVITLYLFVHFLWQVFIDYKRWIVGKGEIIFIDERSLLSGINGRLSDLQEMANEFYKRIDRITEILDKEGAQIAETEESKNIRKSNLLRLATYIHGDCPKDFVRYLKDIRNSFEELEQKKHNVVVLGWWHRIRLVLLDLTLPIILAILAIYKSIKFDYSFLANFMSRYTIITTIVIIVFLFWYFRKSYH